MSNNSFQAVLPQAYWTLTGGTLGSSTGMSYTLETFANRPKEVRITIKGNLTVTASAAAEVICLCQIPWASLPSWAVAGQVGVGLGLMPLASSLGNAFYDVSATLTSQATTLDIKLCLKSISAITASPLSLNSIGIYAAI